MADETSESSAHTLNTLLLSLLPEAWRRDVTVTNSPQGFSLFFTDENGRRHHFEVGPLGSGETREALVLGESLGYGYLVVDPALDVALVVDRYREVLTGFAEAEYDLVAALLAAPHDSSEEQPPQEGQGAAQAAPSTAGAEPFANELSASPELVSIVTRALPEAWRASLSVTLAPDGFVVRFTDGDGHRHALDARALGEGAFVRGQELGFSYTIVDTHVDEGRMLDAYRAALTELASHEQELLPWLHRVAPPAPVEEHAALRDFVPAADEYSAPERLVEVLTEALPEALRHDVVVKLEPGGLVLRCRDAEGGRHIFRASESKPDQPALVSGLTLGFSYLRADEAMQEHLVVGDYRSTLAVLVSREAEILPWLVVPASAGERDAVSVAGVIAEAASPYPNETPAPAELSRIVVASMPEAWRSQAVVSVVPGGFVLRFVDARGRKNLLDARPLHEGALVRGRELGFSYTVVDPAIDEQLAIDEYRAALTDLASHETELLPFIPVIEAPEPEPEVLPLTGSMEPAIEEREAPAALIDLVRSLLPEEWRERLLVTLADGGFIARFYDTAGVGRAISARPIEPEINALVSGKALGFSYLRVDAKSHDMVLAEEYRAVLSSLVTRELEVSELVAASEPEVGRFGHAALGSRAFTSFLVSLLPKGWREAIEVRFAPSEGYSLQCKGDDGEVHLFEAVFKNQPGARDDARYTVDGAECSYSMARGESPGETALEVLHKLKEAERDLLRVAEGSAEPESDRARWENDYPDSMAADGSLAGEVQKLLPEAWSHEVEVLRIPVGFAVTFHDGDGVRHLLEGRRLDAGFPCLIRGSSLGFAYRKVDPALDETLAVPKYREVLMGFASHDAALSAALAGASTPS